ncbi:MAG: hypothetical protein K8R16_11135, partial [Anaerolineales bacterium]|nr:hypothetical protein [Anaerolineales bacterium]
MKKILLISLVIVFLLSSCAPPADQADNSSTLLPSSSPPAADPRFPTPTAPSTGPSAPATQAEIQGTKGQQSYLPILTLAVRDLALQLKIELESITVLSIVSMDWPDGGLGCPLLGINYTQVITPGYRITLEAEGKTYTYHTNTGKALILCADDGPRLPLIPVNPDEIMDGIPWMPVDPI